MRFKNHRGLKIFATTFASLFLVVALTVGGYVAYVFAQFYRIEDNKVLDVSRKSNLAEIETNKELTLTSYNVGFGAYSPEFDFFLDKGIDTDGTLQTGHRAKGISYEDVSKNTEGSINTLKTLDSDFIAIQEIDTDSDRAYHINQVDKVLNEFTSYDSTFANNYHSAYFTYPIYEFIGSSYSGLLTLSKYQIESGLRKQLKITDHAIDKLFDLDRCFSANYIKVANGKTLCLINIHMSAYDEGGLIRDTQIKQLNEFIENIDKDNYVIVAGDYNHDLLTNNPKYEYTLDKRAYSSTYTQGVPPWISMMFDENKESRITNSMSVYAADNLPSLRGCDRPYKYGYTYVSTVDGFLVSNNIEVTSVKTTQVGKGEGKMFSYSDHQPTTLTFKLK